MNLMEERNKKLEKSFDKKTKEKHGIYYTPKEVVDFINQSISDILQKEFGKSLKDNEVEIIDPFTGQGTFIYNLIDDFLDKESIERKIENNEIEAYEIEPSACEIANININEVIRSKTKKDLNFKVKNMDTFEFYEKNLELFNNEKERNLFDW